MFVFKFQVLFEVQAVYVTNSTPQVQHGAVQYMLFPSAQH